MKPPNVNDLIRRYQAGASLAELGRECGVKADTVRAWLARRGVAFRTKAEAIGLAKRNECPPGLIERYLAGESLKALADAYGLARGGIHRSGPAKGKPFGLARLLIESGVALRGRSDAERLKWSRMTDAQRARQGRAAHRARCSPDEIALVLALNELGVCVKHQAEVGPYNLDLALHGLPVAVELQYRWPLKTGAAPAYRQRFKDILDRGYLLLYVAGPLTAPAAVAEEVVALAKYARRRKPRRGGHRVIGGNGKPCPGPCPELDGLPVV